MAAEGPRHLRGLGLLPQLFHLPLVAHGDSMNRVLKPLDERLQLPDPLFKSCEPVCESVVRALLIGRVGGGCGAPALLDHPIDEARQAGGAAGCAVAAGSLGRGLLSVPWNRTCSGGKPWYAGQACAGTGREVGGRARRSISAQAAKQSAPTRAVAVSSAPAAAAAAMPLVPRISTAAAAPTLGPTGSNPITATPISKATEARTEASRPAPRSSSQLRANWAQTAKMTSPPSRLRPFRPRI